MVCKYGIITWIKLIQQLSTPHNKHPLLWSTEAEIETWSVPGGLSSHGHARLGHWARLGAAAGSSLLEHPLQPPDGKSVLFTC